MIDLQNWFGGIKGNICMKFKVKLTLLIIVIMLMLIINFELWLLKITVPSLPCCYVQEKFHFQFFSLDVHMYCLRFQIYLLIIIFTIIIFTWNYFVQFSVILAIIFFLQLSLAVVVFVFQDKVRIIIILFCF